MVQCQMAHEEQFSDILQQQMASFSASGENLFWPRPQTNEYTTNPTSKLSVSTAGSSSRSGSSACVQSQPDPKHHRGRD